MYVVTHSSQLLFLCLERVAGQQP